MARVSGRPTPLSSIADSLCASVVAAEDRRFLWHAGADPSGVARAALSLGRAGGGSTLTQQARLRRRPARQPSPAPAMPAPAPPGRRRR